KLRGDDDAAAKVNGLVKSFNGNMTQLNSFCTWAPAMDANYRNLNLFNAKVAEAYDLAKQLAGLVAF
ncbi:MAG: hypothetical protein ACXVA9_08090, partial [Bdellovibrionales bacterium]